MALDIVILVIGMAVIFGGLYFLSKNKNKKLPKRGKGGRSQPSFIQQSLGRATTRLKSIYRSARRISGSSIVYDNKSSMNYPIHSGKRRPSWRYGMWAGHGGGCVPFFNKEITVYVTLGRVMDSSQRLVITSGGGRQTGNNCCNYSLGFTLGGTAWLEEEGAHSPQPHITPNLIRSPINIGSLSGRTIGIKHIQYRKTGHTYVEGYIDKNNTGQWTQFFRGIDPHGIFRAGGVAPIITKMNMIGENCQEVRIRADGVSALSYHPQSSSINEIVV